MRTSENVHQVTMERNSMGALGRFLMAKKKFPSGSEPKTYKHPMSTSSDCGKKLHDRVRFLMAKKKFPLGSEPKTFEYRIRKDIM